MINILQIISNVDMITQQVGEVSFSHGYATLFIYLHTVAFTFLHHLISNEVNVGKKHLLPQINL